jgi:hypothetical protein
MSFSDVVLIIVILYLVYNLFYKPTLNKKEGFSLDPKNNMCFSTANNGHCNKDLTIGNCTLKMQDDGNLVIYKSGVPVWHTSTSQTSNGPFRLTMQGDGNLVIYNKNNNALWSSNSAGKGPGPFRLMLLEIGALVIQDKNEAIIWNSTRAPPAPPAPPASSTFPLRRAFQIKNSKKSNSCMHSNNLTDTPKIIREHVCDLKDLESKWIYDPSTQMIKNPFTGLCLDDGGVVDGPITDLTKKKIKTNTCDATNPHQKWIYDAAAKRIKNPNKNLCLDDGAGRETPYLNTCEANNNNQFYEPVAV